MTWDSDTVPNQDVLTLTYVKVKMLLGIVMTGIRKKLSRLERANHAAGKLSERELREHIRYCQGLLKRLKAQREQALSGLEEAQKAAIRQVRYIKCGKKDCHCTRGKGHGPYVYLLVWDPVRKSMRSLYQGKA